MQEQQHSSPSKEKRDLLVFQLGPVQDFIAQARSTRDLWSGSFMLSWLMAHALNAVVREGQLRNEDVIMPSINRDDNPLVFFLRDRNALPKDEAEVQRALIPNLPNRFTVLVPAGRGPELAQSAVWAVQAELQRMGNAVWQWLEGQGAKPEWKAQWDEQLGAFLQTSWAVRTISPDTDVWHSPDGQGVSDLVNRMLAARRNTRDFTQWPAAFDDALKPWSKDSLSGKEEVIGDKKFWHNLREQCGGIFKTEAHAYGAVNLIKRLWVHAKGETQRYANYLPEKLNVSNHEVWTEISVSSIPEIAEKNDVTGTSDHPGHFGNPYVAILMFDGDRMGEKLDRFGEKREATRKVSQVLSAFALKRVKAIVESHDGTLVYAGGDDVLAILPSTKAIACAQDIRKAFREEGAAFEFDGSCGIAIGHKKAPLQMLVREARRMEGVAKSRYGRSALAIALYKRSGEIIEWGCKWDSEALPLMRRVTELSRDGRLSGRFPYALSGLLQPYELERLTDAASFEGMSEIVLGEFRHVVSQQGLGLTPKDREELQGKARAYLEELVRGLSQDSGARPGDFINLFLAETFINRLRGEE